VELVVIYEDNDLDAISPEVTDLFDANLVALAYHRVVLRDVNRQ
jgi:hypothetical protein